MRVAVIGYGARIDMLMDSFRHFDPDFKLCAVMDLNNERVRMLLDKTRVSEQDIIDNDLDKIDTCLKVHPIDPDTVNFYDDADVMLDTEKPDGVIIGTHCKSHVFYAKKVLERNLPLYLEKPVAVSIDHLKELKEAYAKSSSEVVISFPLRLTDASLEVKRLVESGIIGKIENVNAYNDVPYGFVYYHDWYRDEEKTQGLFLQKATHDLDIINFITGEKPVEIAAMQSTQIFKGDKPADLRCRNCPEKETCTESAYYITTFRHDTPRNDMCCYSSACGNHDSGSVVIRYESGMHATYTQNFFARKGAARRGARFYGYKGTIDFDYDRILIFDHMSDKVTRIDLNVPADGHGGGDYKLAQNFINVMKGTEKSKSPLNDGIMSALMCCYAKKSAEDKKFYKVEL